MYVLFVVWDVSPVVVEKDGGAGRIRFDKLDFELSRGGVNLSDGSFPPLGVRLWPERHGLMEFEIARVLDEVV